MYRYWKKIVGIVVGVGCLVSGILYAQLTIGPVSSKVVVVDHYGLSLKVVNMHLLMAQGISSFSSESKKEQNIFQLITEMKALVLWDAKVLEKSTLTQRRSILNTYIQQLYTAINLSDYYLSQLNDEIEILDMEMVACQKSKSSADKQYLQSVDSADVLSLPVYLQDAVVYGTCTTEKRILLNAKKIVRDKLLFYVDVLTVKYNFLEKNTDKIVNYYDFFEDQLLEDLLALKKTLEKYDF